MNQLSIKPGDSVLKNESPTRVQSKISKSSEKAEIILELPPRENQAPKLQVPPLRPQMTWQNPPQPQIYQQPWVKIASPIRPLRIRPLDLRFGQQHPPLFALPQAPQCLQQTQVILLIFVKKQVEI